MLKGNQPRVIYHQVYDVHEEKRDRDGDGPGGRVEAVIGRRVPDHGVWTVVTVLHVPYSLDTGARLS